MIISSRFSKTLNVIFYQETKLNLQQKKIAKNPSQITFSEEFHSPKLPKHTIPKKRKKNPKTPKKSLPMKNNFIRNEEKKLLNYQPRLYCSISALQHLRHCGALSWSSLKLHLINKWPSGRFLQLKSFDIFLISF